MINANELMLGDYVLVSGIPRKVEAITKKKIGYHINTQKDNRLYYARLRDIEPIKITHQILEKVFEPGFSEDDFCLQEGVSDISIHIQSEYNSRVTIEDAFFTCNPDVDKFVENKLHLLQNLLRAANIEIDWQL